MLTRLIDFSLKNKFLVLAATAALVLGGVYALKKIPLDAIPDLSDTQVIVYTEWPGQAPQIVQDQVTYPITTKMLSVPAAKVVRGYSFYGFSFVYVIFEDGTDPYWARSRVLEYLNGLQGSLPANVAPRLGPDATGVGWAFMYSLNSKKHDLAELRTMQDWFLRYQLSSVEGVAEVASVGGHVKQYQITVDPHRLHAYNLSISDIAMAVQKSNGEVGGRSVEMGEKEFILRVRGYAQNVEDFRKIAVGRGPGGTPIQLGEVANVQVGPDMRRGIAELNGEGETVGGIVVVRYGVDTREVIQGVKARLDQAMKSLPEGVEYTIVYDRTALIDRAVETLQTKLIEESLVVALICLLFLLHFRSALVAIIILPVAVLMSFIIMNAQGLSSNIMSLGGIAIAIGAMVDAVIIMIENAHKHLERDGGKKPHWDIIRDASIEVGPTLFYSLLVITVSFLPVFTLQAQEGRMFKPLAFTKTYSMGAAALLSVTLAPVLMGFFIRGRIPAEEKNPVNRFLIWCYHPLIDLVIKFRWAVILGAAAIVAWVFFPWNALVVAPLPAGAVKTLAVKLGRIFPYQNLGSEFMPPLYEGDLLYMPTTFPGISPTKAREVLQQTLLFPTARLIARPRVFGADELMHVPQPAVIAPNHASDIDTPLILAALPHAWRARTVVGAAADRFYRRRSYAVASALWINTFPFDRGGDLRGLADAAELLREGRNVLLYPQATRSAGQVEGFRSGVARLCLATGAPLVPVHVAGTALIMPKGRGLTQRGRATVTFGRPIFPRPGEESDELMSRTRAAIAALATRPAS